MYSCLYPQTRKWVHGSVMILPAICALVSLLLFYLDPESREWTHGSVMILLGFLCGSCDSHNFYVFSSTNNMPHTRKWV